MVQKAKDKAEEGVFDHIMKKEISIGTEIIFTPAQLKYFDGSGIFKKKNALGDQEKKNCLPLSVKDG